MIFTDRKYQQYCFCVKFYTAYIGPLWYMYVICLLCISIFAHNNLSSRFKSTRFRENRIGLRVNGFYKLDVDNNRFTYFTDFIYLGWSVCTYVLLRMEELASQAAGGSISAFLCRRETTDRHCQRRRLTTTFIKQLITTNNLIHNHVTSGRSNPQLHAQCIPHSTLLLPPAGTYVPSTHAAWTPSHTCSLAGFSFTVF